MEDAFTNADFSKITASESDFTSDPKMQNANSIIPTSKPVFYPLASGNFIPDSKEKFVCDSCVFPPLTVAMSAPDASVTSSTRPSFRLG